MDDHIIKLFHCWVVAPFWFFHTKRRSNILMGSPLMGIKCREYEKSQFATNIWLYLGNNTR